MGPASLTVAAGNLSIAGEWRGRRGKADCGAYSDEPYRDSFALNCYVGAGFVPIAAGKYMDLVAAPTRGDQAAQFNATVRIVARYDGIPNASARGDRRPRQPQPSRQSDRSL